MKRTTMLAMLLVVGLGATACSGDSEPTERTEGTQGTDGTQGTTDEGGNAEARRYVDEYVEDRGQDSSSGAPAEAGAVDSAVPDQAEVEPIPPIPPGPPGPPDPNSDNTFTDVGDSLWVTAQEDPQSTFALDVDTGSYRVAHKMVEDGARLDPDSIRVEEWVNAFEYGDKAPEEGALGLTVESGAAPRAEDGTALVRVGVGSADLADKDRPQTNITFVIDTSGSMDIANRLGLVQSSLALLVDNLNPEDTISIVTYDSEAAPVLEPTRVSDRDTIIKAIDSLEPGGSTNLEAGLRMGYTQARNAKVDDGLNVVVLASDGVANVGNVDGGELADDIAGAGEEGIHLVTVGYGMGNYNDTLMEQLANQGDGMYAYLDTFEEAKQLFVEDLTPTLTVVARDAKSQVEFDPEFVESYRLIGYQNRALEDEEFRDDTVDAGEIGAGHRVSALYELVPTEAVTDGQVVGEARLRWADPDTGETSEINAPIEWSVADPSDSLRVAALVADSAELLKGNSVVTERGINREQLMAEADRLALLNVPDMQDVKSLLQDLTLAPEGESDGQSQD